MDTRSTRVLFIPAAFRSAYVRERDPQVGAADETGNRAMCFRMKYLLLNETGYMPYNIRDIGENYDPMLYT
ncbi:hypothetical protein NDU88_004795 [Pleurodeles waltl]|uniref:Uncharacterized protein n=1 Tax=Pleurodeles waltl TaxID=8319 RepID=A0AAV7PDI3_PLEWA|nr:hypothetical protein NDU88_004795 [Pleurodeles waltl]